MKKRGTRTRTSRLIRGEKQLVKSKRSTRALTSGLIKGEKQLVKSKRSQTTIFIIVAILIVGTILLFFLLRTKQIPRIPGIEQQIPKDPQGYLDFTLEPIVRKSVETISFNGGYITPNLSREFNRTRVAYLCYNQNYYYSCINQEPVLIEHLKQELKEDIENDVEQAFIDMKKNLEDQGYKIEMGAMKFDVELMPKKILIDINRNVKLTRVGEVKNYENFKIYVLSRFYDIAVVVQEILSQEARFCNFEQQGFTLFYPEFDFDKFKTGDGDTIYTVIHKKTGETFRFAIRGCVVRPAF